MKKYTFTTIKKGAESNILASLDKWSLFWKMLLYLIILSVFILAFCIKGCQYDSGKGDGFFDPEKEIITPNGDTLRGQKPELMDPMQPRKRDPRKGYPQEQPRDTMPTDDPREELRNPEASNQEGEPQDTVSTDDPTGSRDNPNKSDQNTPAKETDLDWPREIIRERNPHLPDSDNNRIPRVNPDNRVSDPETGREIDAAHLFVILDSDTNDETFNSFAEQLAAIYPHTTCSIAYYNTLSKTLLLEVKPEQRLTIKQNLPKQITDISFLVVEVEMFAPNISPNDRAFEFPEYSWQYAPIQAYEAWDITTGSSDVIVAIIDSYFDLDHPDLDGVSVVHPYSVERGNNDVCPNPELMNTEPDAFVHGTHVAGIIFGEMNNSEGACGIAPSCTFMPISLGTNLTNFTQIEGILYAIYKGAKVINLSIGLSFNEQLIEGITIRDQVEFAKRELKESEHIWDYIFKLCEERNVTIVWASGNQNILSAMDSSKRNNNTIRVEAIDQHLRKADYSNFGVLPSYGLENSTISAPGSGIVSTIPYGDYYSLDGTSMAAPIVTGTVALMKSLNSNLTNMEIVEILKSTSKPLQDRNIAGLVQIRDALDMVRGEFLKFDDLISNPEMIIGKWESTTNLPVSINGVSTGEFIRLTMTFDSPYTGVVGYHYVDGGRIGEVCSTEFKVEYSDNEIIIRELSQATSDVGSSFIKAIYYGAPDESGLLSVLYSTEDRSGSSKFYLRKIE